MVRFRTFVALNGISFLLAAAEFFLIDFTSAMPGFCGVAGALGCAFFGGAPLLLQNRDW